MMKSEWLSKNLRPIAFYITFFLFLVTLNLISDNYDYDLWARLIAGMGFVQTGHVIKQDFLSYTPTHIWIDHEWGSSVLFYLAQHFFSNVGLLFLQVIVLFLIYFIIIKIVKLRGVSTTNPYNFVFYFFSACALMQIIYQPVRCHIFSFLFFTLFLYILELSRKGETRPLWALPLIMIIWNNMHGGSVAGIGLIIIYIVGESINRQPVKKYILSLLLSIIVLPINPWGIDYLVFLLQANTMHRVDILEWMNLFTPTFKYVFLEFKFFTSIMLLAETGYIIQSIIQKVFVFDATKFLTVIITLFLAIEHIKLIPFFVIVATAFFYDDFYIFFNFITQNAFNKIAGFKDVLVYIIALSLIFINLSKQNFRPFLDFNKIPIMAIEFIKINELKGNLLTNFEFGSYASYKLYPNNKIFMDGRYEEVYSNDLKLILDMFTAGLDKQNSLLKAFPTDMILLYKKNNICEQLLKNSDWVPIFVDKNFILFINKAMAKKTYKGPSKDIEYYKKTLFDTNISFEGIQ